LIGTDGQKETDLKQGKDARTNGERPAEMERCTDIYKKKYLQRGREDRQGETYLKREREKDKRRDISAKME
jgi:hypothetical protein